MNLRENSPMTKPQPSQLELQVLSVLWDRGPSTVREVLDSMPDGKKRAYTTILSVLQVMERKGLVTHTRKDVTHVYRPAVGRKKVVRPLLQELVANVFGGSTSTAMQHLLNETKVDEAELTQIRHLIDQYAQDSVSKRKRGSPR
jgi:predicted transcriptional regulator